MGARASVVAEGLAQVMTVDLDQWIAKPAVRVNHRRKSSAGPDELWEAARAVRLSDTRMLGRLIRWRMPGTPGDISFAELFSEPPFVVLSDDGDRALVSGMVGRIWTLRRDYPQLRDADEYRDWSTPGTARVLFANWVEEGGNGGASLVSEARVEAIGRQGRVGVAAVRPLVRAFQHLVASEGIAAAVRTAEGK